MVCSIDVELDRNLDDYSFHEISLVYRMQYILDSNGLGHLNLSHILVSTYLLGLLGSTATGMGLGAFVGGALGVTVEFATHLLGKSSAALSLIKDALVAHYTTGSGIDESAERSLVVKKNQ